MEHRDAAIREVLLIALEKYESGEDTVFLTSDEVNTEAVRKGLRDPKSLEGKVKGSLIGAYRKRETLSTLSRFIKRSIVFLPSLIPSRSK